MNQISLRLLLVSLASAFSLGTLAQAQGQTLAATIDMYVFPSSGQDSSQQSKDESECYNWAVSNVGTDPFQLAKQAQSDAELAQAQTQAAQQTGSGSAAKGALRGAAAGALIGEIASDDAGKGAAWGAAAGAVRGRRRGAQARNQATQQAESQQASRDQATETELTNFKNAFSVCLEAKEYMVKY